MLTFWINFGIWLSALLLQVSHWHWQLPRGLVAGQGTRSPSHNRSASHCPLPASSLRPGPWCRRRRPGPGPQAVVPLSKSGSQLEARPCAAAAAYGTPAVPGPVPTVWRLRVQVLLAAKELPEAGRRVDSESTATQPTPIELELGPPRACCCPPASLRRRRLTDNRGSCTQRLGC